MKWRVKWHTQEPKKETRLKKKCAHIQMRNCLNQNITKQKSSQNNGVYKSCHTCTQFVHVS